MSPPSHQDKIFDERLPAPSTNADVLISVIGNRWLGRANARIEQLWFFITRRWWQHRIQQYDDYVRYELRAALERGVPLIPVLVDGARFPSRHELPDDIQHLVYKQATRVRADPAFHGDMSKLINTIRLHAPRKARSTAIRLGYLLGKFEVFIRSTEHGEHQRAEAAIQKITWLANNLGLAFDIDRGHGGAPVDMRLSVAGLRDDVRAAFEVGYHTGRFYGMALVFVATGLVRDDAVVDDFLQETNDLLPKAGLQSDFLYRSG